MLATVTKPAAWDLVRNGAFTYKHLDLVCFSFLSLMCVFPWLMPIEKTEFLINIILEKTNDIKLVARF